MRVLTAVAVALFGAPAVGRTAMAAETSIDVRPRRLARLEPGLVVDKAAPEGWSHLILKSQPRVAAGDVNDVPKLVLRNSDFLFTVFAARVVATGPNGGGPYVLDQVAVGLGTDVAGQPRIVSSDTHRDLGADLGLLRSTVLSQSEKQLDAIIALARTPQMMVFDAPGYYATTTGHQPIALRYHVLVDSSSGRLDTVTWMLRILDDPPRYDFVDDSVRLLDENLVEDSILSVSADEFLLGVPKPSAFALTSQPPGKRLELPATLRPLADRVRFRAEEVQLLQSHLRRLVREARQ